MITVQGTLVTPLSEIIPDAEIRLTAIVTGLVVQSAESVYITDSLGNYNFTIQPGTYRLEVNVTDEYSLISDILIDEFTPTPLSIETLALYTSPVTPPEFIPQDPDWNNLYDTLRDALDSIESTAHRQVRIGDTWVSNKDIVTVNERMDAELAEDTKSVSSRNVGVTEAVTAYSDAADNESATAEEILNTRNLSLSQSEELYEASNGNTSYVSSKEFVAPLIDLLDDTTVSGLDVTTLSKKEVGNSQRLETTSVSDTLMEAETTSIKYSKVVSDTDSVEATLEERLSLTNDILATKVSNLTLDHSGSIGSTVSDVTVMVNPDDEVTILASKQYTVNDKTLSEEIVNNGFTTSIVRKADTIVYSAADDTSVVSIDTVNKEVRLDAKLIISNPEDFKGASYYLEYQYSSDDGVTSPWHDVFAAGTDTWRRHREVTNGVYALWSDGYLLVAEDGLDGDTLYIEYRYSSNQSNWHTVMEDGDVWRQERTIANGAPTSQWSAPSRIQGFDGSNGEITEIAYQYAVSISGDNEAWHSNFSTGDHFRRERYEYFKTAEDRDADNPYLFTPWTSPAKIVPEEGIDYGYKHATLYLYQRTDSEPTATTATLHYDFIRQELTGDLQAWSQEIPTGEGNLWVAAASTISYGDSDTIGPNEWVISQLVTDGYSAKTVRLDSNTYVITYDAYGDESPASQAVTLTANSQNHISPIYTFFREGLEVQSSTSNTYVLLDSDKPLGNQAVTFSVESAESSLPAVVTATDGISLYGSQEALPGIPGQDGTDGTNGQDGTDGQNGTDGTDGKDGTGVAVIGSVATAGDLDPNYAGDIGDMFIAQDTGHGHVWSGVDWDAVGQIKGDTGNPGTDGTDGTNGTDGTDGLDAYTIVVTNENHTVPAKDDGTVISYVGSGTRIIVYKGQTQLIATLNTSPTAGQFSVVSSVVSGTITIGNESIDGTDTVIGQHSNLLTDTASIRYLINVEGSVYQKLQSVNKSKDGYTPSKGLDYDDGVDGNNVRVEYSPDGVSGWTTTLIAGVHKYIRTSIDTHGNGEYIPGNAAKFIPEEGIEYTVTDGVSSYLHIKYSDDGSTFTGNNGEVLGNYIGTYVDTTAEDSINFDDYDWKRYVGEDGYQSAPVFLYIIEDALVPTVPPAHDLTFTFATGEVSDPIYGTFDGWSPTVPSNTVPGGKVMVTSNIAFGLATQATDILEAENWSHPTVFSQNGTNGTDGTDGVDGTDGLHGTGSYIFYTDSTSSIPESSASKSSAFTSFVGRSPQTGDLLTYTSFEYMPEEDKFSVSFIYAEDTQEWESFAFVVDGNALIDGTLAARKLKADTITGDYISAYSTIKAGSGTDTQNYTLTIGYFDGFDFPGTSWGQDYYEGYLGDPLTGNLSFKSFLGVDILALVDNYPAMGGPGYSQVSFAEALPLDVEQISVYVNSSDTPVLFTKVTDRYYYSDTPLFAGMVEGTQVSITLEVSGNGIAVLNGDDTNEDYAGYRIWAGTDLPIYAPFSVSADGSLLARNATVTGHVEATSGYFSGDLVSNSITGADMSASNIAGTVISGATILGSSFYGTTFLLYCDPYGNGTTVYYVDTPDVPVSCIPQVELTTPSTAVGFNTWGYVDSPLLPAAKRTGSISSARCRWSVIEEDSMHYTLTSYVSRVSNMSYVAKLEIVDPDTGTVLKSTGDIPCNYDVQPYGGPWEVSLGSLSFMFNMSWEGSTAPYLGRLVIRNLFSTFGSVTDNSQNGIIRFHVKALVGSTTSTLEINVDNTVHP